MADNIKVMGQRYEREAVEPNSSMFVGVAIDMDTTDDTVTVRWRNSPDGVERFWRHPAVEAYPVQTAVAVCFPVACLAAS